MKFVGDKIRKGYSQFNNWRNHANSRKEAHHNRKIIAKGKKHPVVGRREIRLVKEYAGDVFGDAAYWPWLACYMEIRGEFIEGWVPDDYYRFNLIRQLNPVTEAMLSTAKSFDHRLFEGFSIKPLGIKISGGYYSSEMEPLSEKVFIEKIREEKSEVVIKLDGGPSGTGVNFKYSGDVTPGDFIKGRNYVVQPLMEQHDILKKINSSSLNTIRIVTLLQPSLGVSLRYASLKFGAKGSRIDNLGMGGLFYSLSEEGSLVSGPYNFLGQKIEADHLPDPGTHGEKLTLPSFQQAVEKCFVSHLLYPYVRLIGWDVAIDRTGTPKLVEWNAREPGNMPEEALIGPIFPKEISYPNLKF